MNTENKNTLNKVLSKQYLIDEVKDLIENGVPIGYKLGIPSIDEIFRYDTSMVNVVSGVPNFGKSEFLDFINVRLNKFYGLKVMYFSPENTPVKLHLKKLLSKLTNKAFNELTKEEIDNEMNYITDNFFFLNYETVNTLDDILAQAEQLIIEKGVQIINIDPFNSLEHARPANFTETEYVSQVMTRLQKFSKRFNVLVNLVVHPKKLLSDANGDTIMPSRYDMNGSANFANKADYIIIVHRDFVNNATIIKCDKCKFANYGKIGQTIVKYDIQSTNYFDLTDKDYSFEFDKEDKQQQIYDTAKEVLANKEEEDKRNVLNVDVSFFVDKTEKKGKQINLYDYLLDANKYYYNQYSKTVNYIRDAKDEIEKRKRKNESSLPAITLSCLCGEDKSDIKTINNLLCIDIDKKDNELIIDRIPALIKSLKCIAYMSKSVSGQGYYCIIPISNTDKFKQHFNALQDDFAKMGITIDKSCSNANRLRYYSYDDNSYINIKAETYTSLLDNTKIKEAKEQHIRVDNTNIVNVTDIDLTVELRRIMDMIDYLKTNNIDITKDYSEWISVGAAIANTFGNRGYILFDSISKLSDKYDSYECEFKYQNLCKNPLNQINLSTLYYIFSKHKKQHEDQNAIH